MHCKVCPNPPEGCSKPVSLPKKAMMLREKHHHVAENGAKSSQVISVQVG